MAGVFHVVDYVIFGLTLVVSLGIGIYFAVSGGRQRTTAEYHVGNRRMMVLPVAVSLMVSFESSIMMLGVPAENYVYGLQWMISQVGSLLSYVISAIWIVPMIHPLNITSAYEYLELRFESRAVRLVGTTFGMISYVIYMGVVLFGPAVALEAVTGFPQWASIVLIAIASVIYTSIGGLKAVIWTDVFQAVILFTGVFALIIKGTMEVGGVTETWDIAQENGRVNLFIFDPDPTIRHTFWNLFIGGGFLRGLGRVFNQATVQRISSTPTLRDAQKALLITGPLHCLALFMASVEGLLAYAYYHKMGCDPLADKQISNPNQIIARMVTDLFQSQHGMAGLFIASLFSASLSTLSSGFSSLSSLFWTDVVKPHNKPMSEQKATLISKCSVIVFGCIGIGVAFLIGLIGGTLVQVIGSIMSAFSGPLVGMFLLGCLFPWSNAKGAVCGAVVAMVFVFTVSMGQMLTPGSVKNQKLAAGPLDNCPVVYNIANVTVAMTPAWIDSSSSTESALTSLYAATSLGPTGGASPTEPSGFSRLFMLSYQWFGAAGTIITLVLGTIVSLATGGNKNRDVTLKYLLPVLRRRMKLDHREQESKEKAADGVTSDGQFTTILRKEKFDIEMVITDNTKL